MNGLDIFIIAVPSFFGIYSMFRGFIREIFALAGVILGVIAANIFYADVAIYLSPYIRQQSLCAVTSYASILIGIAIAMFIAGRIMNKIIQLVLLKWLDRLLGLIFGAVKGLVIVTILVMGLELVLPSQSSFLTASTLKPYVEKTYGFLPANFISIISAKKKQVETYIKKQSGDHQKQPSPVVEKKTEPAMKQNAESVHKQEEQVRGPSGKN